MKGIVYTEFLELVDQVFSPDITEKMILSANPESGGIYTATDTYDHQELLDMVVTLSRMTDLPVKTLVKTFGQHLFRVFSESSVVKITPKEELFDFLESIENYIHVEVRKLYPDASLPTIKCNRSGGKTLDLHYLSKCPFADLAEGLIEESATHFNTPISLTRSANPSSAGKARGEAGTEAIFHIEKTT